MSVSIGGVTQGEHETMDSAVRRADRLLYHAKTTKNEVVVESDNTLSESVQTKNYVKPLILIVDDCDMNREILREILSSDYSIMEACGGEEALSMIHSSERAFRWCCWISLCRGWTVSRCSPT